MTLSNENPIGPPKRARRYWETSDFWKDAGERIVTGFLIGSLAPLSGEALVTEGGVNWKLVVVGGGVGAMISTVKAIIGAQRKDTTTPVSIV